MKKQIEKNIVKSRIEERSLRKAVQLTTHLIVHNKKYEGSITNISSSGVGMFIDTNFRESTIDCTEGSILTLELKSTSGESISLQCSIKWLRIQKYAQNTLTTSMGMEVMHPPENFIQMFREL